MKPTYLVCAVLLAAGCGHKPPPHVDRCLLTSLSCSSFTTINAENVLTCIVEQGEQSIVVKIPQGLQVSPAPQEHREAKPSVVHRLYSCGEPIDPQANEICVSRHEVFGFGAPQNPQAKEDKP